MARPAASRGAISVLCRAPGRAGVAETYAVDMLRPWRRRARAATSPISGSSRTISPISSASSAATIRRRRWSWSAIPPAAGLALRVAGSPIQGLFTRTVLLAPYLGYDAPTSRPNSGGWASADIPRFLALSVLHRLEFALAESSPTLALAGSRQPPPGPLTSIYSYRLMRSYCGPADFRQDLAAATRLVAIFARRRRRTDVFRINTATPSARAPASKSSTASTTQGSSAILRRCR